MDSLGTGLMLCDAEVAHDDPGHPDNEGLVDGVSTSGTVGESWDDGGRGGACHTYHYSTPGFNTFGCQTGQAVFADTHAGTGVWVGASCDWKEDQGGASSGTLFVLCVVNSLLAVTLDLTVIVAEVLALAQCVLDYVLCLLDPTGCGVTGAIQVCGPDGASDAINYGYGSGGTTGAAHFPANVGIMNGNPPVPWACPPGNEVASIFVFDTIATSGGSFIDLDGAGPLPPVYDPQAPLPSVERHPAGSGELWT
jgi:hypothetical protein